MLRLTAGFLTRGSSLCTTFPGYPVALMLAHPPTVAGAVSVLEGLRTDFPFASPRRQGAREPSIETFILRAGRASVKQS